MRAPAPSTPRRHRASGRLGRLLAAGFAAVLLGLGGLGLWRSSQEPPRDAPQLEFAVEGLDCPFWCAVRLCDGIDGLGGAKVERFDARRGTVVVRYAPGVADAAGVQRRIEERGFRVLSVVPVVP